MGGLGLVARRRLDSETTTRLARLRFGVRRMLRLGRGLHLGRPAPARRRRSGSGSARRRTAGSGSGSGATSVTGSGSGSLAGMASTTGSGWATGSGSGSGSAGGRPVGDRRGLDDGSDLGAATAPVRLRLGLRLRHRGGFHAGAAGQALARAAPAGRARAPGLGIASATTAGSGAGSWKERPPHRLGDLVSGTARQRAAPPGRGGRGHWSGRQAQPRERCGRGDGRRVRLGRRGHLPERASARGRSRSRPAHASSRPWELVDESDLAVVPAGSGASARRTHGSASSCSEPAAPAFGTTKARMKCPPRCRLRMPTIAEARWPGAP